MAIDQIQPLAPRGRWLAWIFSILATIVIAWRWSPLWGLIVPAGLLVQTIFAVRVAAGRPGSMLARFLFVLLLTAASLGLVFVAILVWMSGAGPHYN